MAISANPIFIKTISKSVYSALRKEEAKCKLAIKMKIYGENMGEIIKETGLSKAEIEKL